MGELAWRHGSIDEVVALSLQIPEFDNPYGADEYHRRLQEGRYLIQIAEVDGEAAGFYASYANSPQELYLWMSGVVPQFRGLKLASMLLEGLQHWAKQQGFERITVKSRNRYPAKLRLLLGNGFHIVELMKKGDSSLDYRIRFAKHIGA
ncbi:GNAT family N-acetyltransferase [Ferrimonas lipolytica]|uniref:GNAT family N-acetyltransferase n=1 Tax=Ferrimonas lipolytica TaxID=2724191 RepID=A0A6H1UGW4_9GAMM|nr:GNAT family N-acetyltransferase [Ferrimonas lipolytica]QIZ78284.1 GNAT family N-acetyltransferase [Ferrimonas lipolytica]